MTKKLIKQEVQPIIEETKVEEVQPIKEVVEPIDNLDPKNFKFCPICGSSNISHEESHGLCNECDWQYEVKTKVKTKKLGIGKFVVDLLLKEESKKKTNKELSDMVKERFPEAKTTASCIAWYKNNLKTK